MKVFRTIIVVLALCMSVGCVALTSKTRLQSMEEEIDVLKEELRLTRDALVAETGKESETPQNVRHALRTKIALIDLELEGVREQLGDRHAKTVDLEERRARLMRKLLTMDAEKK